MDFVVSRIRLTGLAANGRGQTAWYLLDVIHFDKPIIEYIATDILSWLSTQNRYYLSSIHTGNRAFEKY